MALNIVVKGVRGALSSVIDRFQRRAEARFDEEMRKEAGLVREDIITGWPIDTGASRAGWQGPIKIVGGYQLRNDYPYASTIEYGTYPGVGPKTVAVGSTTLPGGININKGIYPSQRPAAPVRRALSKSRLRINRDIQHRVFKGTD